MLCVACGQLTNGDFLTPCDICGRLQIIDDKYVLVHMVGMVGEVRTYNGVRIEDEVPVTCTMWRVPTGKGDSKAIEKVVKKTRKAAKVDGCLAVDDWFFVKGAHQTLADIRARDACIWLSPTMEGELWELEKVQKWMDRLSELAIALKGEKLGELAPCFRLGRLLVSSDLEQIRSVDMGLVRAEVYGAEERSELQIPILKRLNLEAYWHSWAATCLQLLGGMSVYGLHLLGEALSELEQNTMLDLLEGIVEDKKVGVSETNIYRLDALRNLLVECASRFGARAPTLATQRVERWVPSAQSPAGADTLQPEVKVEPATIPLTVTEETLPPETEEFTAETTAESYSGDIETEEVEGDDISLASSDLLVAELEEDSTAEQFDTTASPTLSSVTVTEHQPVNLRQLHADKQRRKKNARIRETSERLFIIGVCMILLGWPVIAWQFSFGQAKNNIDTAGQQLALEHILGQISYNPSLRQCFDQGNGGVVLNLKWSGNAPPQIDSHRPGWSTNKAFDDCWAAATEAAPMRWITPGSGSHETQIAWQMLWVE